MVSDNKEVLIIISNVLKLKIPLFKTLQMQGFAIPQTCECKGYEIP